MKENHLRLVRHMAVNIVLLLAAVMVLLLAAAHRTYTRQMERLDVYIGVLSGRTAQHAGDVFQDKHPPSPPPPACTVRRWAKTART